MFQGFAEYLTGAAIERFAYLGIFAVLLLASLGVPIPEEMPIIAAAVLSHEGSARWWIALPVCIVGVPFWKFFATDAGAALLGVPTGFGVAYFFTDQVVGLVADVRRVERWIGLAIVLIVALALTLVTWRTRRRITLERKRLRVVP